MTIKVGDTLPPAQFRVMTADGVQVKTTDDIFKGKKVALFAVPGAYTGTCHKMHMPSIFLNAYALKEKGIDTIAVVSVNDAFVMVAWNKSAGSDDITMLADGNGEFAEALGLTMDGSGFGLGKRGQRARVARLHVHCPFVGSNGVLRLLQLVVDGAQGELHLRGTVVHRHIHDGFGCALQVAALGIEASHIQNHFF